MAKPHRANTQERQTRACSDIEDVGTDYVHGNDVHMVVCSFRTFRHLSVPLCNHFLAFNTITCQAPPFWHRHGFARLWACSLALLLHQALHLQKRVRDRNSRNLSLSIVVPIRPATKDNRTWNILLGANTPHDRHGVNVLHLPAHHPNLMTIWPRTQAVKLTQHINTTKDLINHVSPQTILLRTTTTGQRSSARVGVSFVITSVLICMLQDIDDLQLPSTLSHCVPQGILSAAFLSVHISKYPSPTFFNNSLLGL
jgi:hypothetical protein